MTAIAVIVSIIAYIAAGAWTFGFIRAAVDDKEDGWQTPVPILSAICWPFVLIVLVLKSITMPADALGFAFKQRQLEKQKKRIELQEKIRIELKKNEQEIAKAEQELEEEFEALDAATKLQKKSRSRGKIA